MSLPKLLAWVSLILFGAIGFAAFFNQKKLEVDPPQVSVQIPLEVELDESVQTILPVISSQELEEIDPGRIVQRVDLPDADRIEELFSKNGQKLPIVETISYKSHTSWQKGRPAWLSDYASHYHTSRHFIARSLNGKVDYLKQDVAEGDRFNILRNDKNFEFYLVVDTSRCLMWFYYIDSDEKKKVLLKRYTVGLGRLDDSKTSGLLTPLGKYSLGQRIAIFKPKVMANYQGKKTEMVTVFGTRWIPFDKEIANCTDSAKGLGIHGTPWVSATNGTLIDQSDGIGKFESDGCIRLATKDIEELFAIIISRPTTIEIVPDFAESSFAGLNFQNE